MKHHPLIRLPEGCELCQQRLSEIADSGKAPPPELLAHLADCADCARFAELWLQGPPAILAQPMSSTPDTLLRERILRDAAPANVVRFPTPVIGLPSRTTWFGRIAACLVLAGFAYWLLDPTVSHGPVHPAKPDAPTLAQGLLQMEGGTKREQRALQAALVDGSRRVRGDMAWSMSALEL